MKKNTLITLIVFVIFSLLLAACQSAANGGAPSEPEAPAQEPAQPEPAATPVAPEEPGADMPADVMFDPAMGVNADTIGLVYEHLLKVQDGALVPALALAGTVSDDGLDYIITLRPGVTFHNGALLNADAVIANFDRWYDPANVIGAWAVDFGGFRGETDADGKPKSIYDGIEKVDELTVLIHLNEPDAEFLNKLAHPTFAIVSPDALAAPGFGTAAGIDGGTGPYMISAWSDTGLTLDPYADYWNPNAVPEASTDVTFK